MSTGIWRRLRIRVRLALHPIPVPMIAPVQRNADELLERNWRLRVTQNETRRDAKRRPQLRVVEDDTPMFLRHQWG